MPIVQTIKYNSENNYFAGFLQNTINKSGILGSVEQKDNEIILKLDNSDEESLNEFNSLAKYIPHSIFMGEIETSESDEKIAPSDFKSKDYNISPCAKCIELVNDPSSEHYLDESLICNHYSNDAVESYSDHTIFSPHYSDDCTLLVTDSNKLSDLFIITEDEAKVLFSIEKPTIKVTIKDETLKELVGDKFINIRSPYNIKSMLASINAKESGISYLFFYPQHDLDVVLVQNNTSIIKSSRVAKELESLEEDGVLNRFLNIKKEAGFQGKQAFEKSAIASYLSTSGIEFIVSNEVGTKKVIKFGDFNLKKVIEGFKSNEKRARLFENLKSKYPQVAETLETKDLDLFESVATILEIENKTFEGVCNKGYEFRGNGGLKIDTNFNEDGFDYEAFIGSLISFKLADVDMPYLAYSMFEAIGDLSITVMSQLKTKFKIENFIIMGDMLANSVIYSRILSKFQLNNPYFSKSFALDD